jgi:predicted RNase H-like HicB family nuclease
MTQRFYPAVLERGTKATFAVWFPDFPDVVAAARTQEEVMAKAQYELAQAVVELFERNKVLPEPTPFERVRLPSDCDLITLVALGVDPPNPSERVNIYLPKQLLERVDRRATEMGMSRSSYFGLAANLALNAFGSGVGVTKETLKRLDPWRIAVSKESVKKTANPKPRRRRK